MRANGAITQAEYAWAGKTPLVLKPGTLYVNIRHPNFFGWAEEQLIDRYGRRRVEAGGLKGTTTIDSHLQTLGYDDIRSHLPHSDDQAAALGAIDPRTGADKAM